MKPFLKTINFWLIFGLIASVLFVSAINLERVYQAKMDILVLPKVGANAFDTTTTLDNIKQIVYSPTVYREVLSLDDSSNNYNLERLWTSKVEIKRIGNSSVLRLSVMENNRNTAQAEIDQIFKELSNQVSKYYNIKTELDMRVLDESIVTTTVRYGFLNLFVLSISGAFILAFLFFYLFSGVLEGSEETVSFSERMQTFPLPGLEEMRNRMKTQKDTEVKEKSTEKYSEIYKMEQDATEWIKEHIESLKKNITSEPAAEKKESKLAEIKKEESKKEPQQQTEVKIEKKEETAEPKKSSIISPITPFKKSGTSGSLPIANEEDIEKLKQTLYPKEAKKNNGGEKINEAKEEKIDEVRQQEEMPKTEEEREEIIKEPTPEEVKERLNKLLSGKF